MKVKKRSYPQNPFEEARGQIKPTETITPDGNLKIRRGKNFETKEHSKYSSGMQT